jgi:predicted ATP-binding protein involved in virulence
VQYKGSYEEGPQQAGEKSVKVPATWLSQGYQGMIAWVADVIGHQFWEIDAEVPVSEMEGLVLIDELDLFLHPKWQVGLIRALKATFPRLQFVVTTHSPMLLVSCERDEVCILREDDYGNI